MSNPKIFAYFKLVDDSAGIEEFDTMEQAIEAWKSRLQYVEEVQFFEGKRVAMLHGYLKALSKEEEK